MISQNLLAKPIDFEGLSKFDLNDIQTITSIDIYDQNLQINDIDKILKELSMSDLIYEISLEETNEQYIFSITEADIIENVYINNNVWINIEVFKIK